LILCKDMDTGHNMFFKENYFDEKRYELLSSIYAGKYNTIERVYSSVLEKINIAYDLTEADQKAVNQIQLIFRRFKEKIGENCSSNIWKVNTNIRKTIAKIVKQQINKKKYVEYDTWRKKIGLTDAQFCVMLQTVTTLQMTTGCNSYCRRCNEWALPGDRKHFSFSAVKRLTQELFETGNREFSHYGASDPLDWKWGDKNIIDIVVFMAEKGYKPKFGLLTKIPKGTEKIAETLFKMDADVAVSITGKNRDRVIKLEKAVEIKFEVQHDMDELLIPAGLDEDFKSIKSSITDNYGTEITPDGAFQIIPTFTSALNPTGQFRIRVTADTCFFLIKRVGRDALPVEYFKPLRAIGFDGSEYTLDRLFDTQIESILLDNGSEEITPPGMMNLAEYFKIYETDAVQRRNKLLPAVEKDLKKRILYHKNKHGVSIENLKNLYYQKLHFYKEFCQMESVLGFKKNAFSFYLKSIAEYLKRSQEKREIIRYLRSKDKYKFESKYDEVFINRSCDHIDDLLEECNVDTFELFQILLFRLLDYPENEMINNFCMKHPVIYDEKADRFIDLKK